MVTNTHFRSNLLDLCNMLSLAKIVSCLCITSYNISNEISVLQPTYGVAGNSLVLLSSYPFSIGLYASAISLSW